MRVGIARLGRNRAAQRRGGPLQVALLRVDDAERVVRLGAPVFLHNPPQLANGLVEAVGALQDEREVVARQRVPRRELERAAEAGDALPSTFCSDRDSPSVK